MRTLRWIYARSVFPITLLWNLFNTRVLRRWHWWDRVDDTVIIGALPFASHVESLKSEDVVAVVNTCEEYPGPVDAYRAAGIEQLRVPTIDFTPPTLESVESAVRFIEGQAPRGSVYVHCKAGRARSATVVVCWLIASRGMTPEEAQKYLQARRGHVNPHVFQRNVVREYYAKQKAAVETDGS